ncbi:immediate early response gene 2 protein [Electrophorus electricus]|uniref:Immediate early response 2b n=1 Tax=Electrophorus electricus TaxID=8005 RepID=A0A4W4EUM2_ELEEL|nr:immediate early response gene 2 protein [Electrophorus electricus]
MDISGQAKRIMVQALSKMYSSRTQRGGLRLHRSLLLTLVMKSARDIYHSARLVSEKEEQCARLVSTTKDLTQKEESIDTTSTEVSGIPVALCALATRSSEGVQRSKNESDPTVQNARETRVDKENCSPPRPDRHSRKRRGKTATEPDFLPCKKAKMDSGEVRRILHDATLRSNSGNCGREMDTLSTTHMLRTVVTC